MAPKLDDLPKQDADLVHNVAQTVRQGRNVTLLQMLTLKSRLKDRFPIQDAFRLYNWYVAPGPQVRLRPQKVRFQIELAETQATALHVVHEGGEALSMRPCRMRGAPAQTGPINGIARRVFVACFENAAAFSRSSAIRLSDGVYGFDLQEGELGALPVDLAFDPLIFDQTGPELAIIDDRRPNTRLHMSEAISFMGIDTMSFGHWMAEEFFQFLTARQLPETAGLPVLIDAGMPPQHRESLVAFLGPRHPIIEVPRFFRVECERLWVAGNWFYSPKILTTDKNVDPGKLAIPSQALGDVLTKSWDDLDRMHGAPEPGGAVFVARNQDRHRNIANHGEVTSALERGGYRAVRPEELSFMQQYRIYRQADRLVFQSGSAMHGAFMCRPGTRVCLLSPPAMPFNALWSDLLRARGIDAVALVGDCAVINETYGDKSSYSLDLAELDAILSDMRGETAI